MAFPLASFNKCSAAFRTSDLNLAFTARYPYLLSAGRTGINMMSLSLGKEIFLSAYKCTEFTGFTQIPLVFGRTLIDVLREHTVIGSDNSEP